MNLSVFRLTNLEIDEASAKIIERLQVSDFLFGEN